MLGAKTLLFTTLGLGTALILWATGEAKASPKTEPEAKPAPKPTSGTQAAAQQGGAECRTAFQEWQNLANASVGVCAKAAAAADEWWVWEEYRLAGEFSYDAAYHEQLRRNWQMAQEDCDAINGNALAAMAHYESCMVDLGLNPALPSAATQGW